MQQDKTTANMAEVDMIQECFNLLCKVGLQNKAQEHFLTHQWITDAKGIKAEGQRFLLNRYWRLQVGMIEKNTIAERWCLVENGEMKDWLRLFEEKIIPFCLENDLPRNFEPS